MNDIYKKQLHQYLKIHHYMPFSEKKKTTVEYINILYLPER